MYRRAFSEWDLVETGNGRDALVTSLVRPPTLIITELHLPELDASALCEIWRRDRMTGTVPILVVTDETSDDLLNSVRRAGADAVLTKPLPVQAVVRTSHELLTQSRDARPQAPMVRAQAVEPQLKSSGSRNKPVS
jgi:DNA-binding response OmpR family regulator